MALIWPAPAAERLRPACSPARRHRPPALGRPRWLWAPLVFAGLLFADARWPLSSAAAQRVSGRLAQAAIVHKLLFFTSLPPRAPAAKGRTVSICLVGKDPFGDRFKAVEGTRVGRRSLRIRRLGWSAPTAALSTCHLLYVAEAPRAQVRRLLERLRGAAVLTVSDLSRFVELGGMIGLVRKNGRLGFEINRSRGNRVGITFRSKLLRLAVRVL